MEEVTVVLPENKNLVTTGRDSAKVAQKRSLIAFFGVIIGSAFAYLANKFTDKKVLKSERSVYDLNVRTVSQPALIVKLSEILKLFVKEYEAEIHILVSNQGHRQKSLLTAFLKAKFGHDLAIHLTFMNKKRNEPFCC